MQHIASTTEKNKENKKHCDQIPEYPPFTVIGENSVSAENDMQVIQIADKNLNNDAGFIDAKALRETTEKANEKLNKDYIPTFIRSLEAEMMFEAKRGNASICGVYDVDSNSFYIANKLTEHFQNKGFEVHIIPKDNKHIQITYISWGNSNDDS